MDCRCEDFEAGARDMQRGQVRSPYQLIYLRHPACYRAGQREERLKVLEQTKQKRHAGLAP